MNDTRFYILVLSKTNAVEEGKKGRRSLLCRLEHRTADGAKEKEADAQWRPEGLVSEEISLFPATSLMNSIIRLV